jgi:hypothetical protein
MIDLSKGLSLFISNDQSGWSFNGLLNFLSDEYNILFVSFGKTTSPSGYQSFSLITVDDDNYKERIKQNLFRVNFIVINISKHIKDSRELLKFLSELNIITFIITSTYLSIHILDNNTTSNYSESKSIVDSAFSNRGPYVRNFYEITENKNYTQNNRFSSPNANIDLGSISDRHLFRNIINEEEFTLNQYKKSYIRDKKIDIFLDDNDLD